MNDNEWQRVVQWVTTSGITNGTTSGNEWQWVVISVNFNFFEREESSNRHPKENPLNFEDDLEEDLLI